MNFQYLSAIFRAEQLISVHRYKDAETELRRAVAQIPDHARAHFLLAITLENLGNHQEAKREAQTVIHLEPDSPFGHYALAVILQHLEHDDEAMSAIQEAIRLDPQNPEFYAVLSEIYYNKRQWQAALQAAEEGLKVEPEHIKCLNYRSSALNKLGRKSEAQFVLSEALAKAPQEELTHASQGWLQLQHGQHQQALEHFREALRINPNYEYARSGIVEALKARNFVYRVMLRYFFWMSSLSAGQQWGILIGGFILLRIIRGASQTNPDLEVAVIPLYVVYGVFVFLTWTSPALFNLTLRLNRFGRLSLSKEQINASNWVGFCLLSGLLLGVLGLFVNGDMQNELFEAAIKSAVMIIPISGVFHARRPKTQQRLALYSLGLAALIVLKLALEAAGSPSPALTSLFILGFVAYTWIANLFISKE